MTRKLIGGTKRRGLGIIAQQGEDIRELQKTPRSGTTPVQKHIRSGGGVSPGTFNDHHDRHENGGDDEISVAGLSGQLADGQTPVDHDHSGDAGDGGSTLIPAVFRFVAATELTINAGAITVTQSHHTIDTEGDGASDDLATINGLAANQLYILRPANDARTVVVKHGTGNIECVGGADYTLDDIEDWIWVISPDGATAYALQGGGGGGGDAGDITYTPNDNSDWDGNADPGDVDNALDQLAERLTNGSRFIPASAMWPSTTNGCAEAAKREFVTNDLDLWVLGFDKDTDEYAQFSIVLPVWDNGTVTATIFWTTTVAAGGTVCWSIQGVSLANDDAIDAAWGALVSATDTGLGAGDMHKITTDAITVADAGAGELVQFRIMRDVSEDDNSADADLLGVLINYNRRDA